MPRLNRGTTADENGRRRVIPRPSREGRGIWGGGGESPPQMPRRCGWLGMTFQELSPMPLATGATKYEDRPAPFTWSPETEGGRAAPEGIFDPMASIGQNENYPR